MNECDDGTDDCHVNGNCLNNPGSFSCECKDGYSGSGRDCSSLYISKYSKFQYFIVKFCSE